MSQTANTDIQLEEDFGLVQPGRAHFRLVGWFCVASAVVSVFALLLSLQVVRIGDLIAFSPVKLMRFVADNQLIWRLSCLLNALSSVSKVLLFLMLNIIVDRRARLLTRIGLVLSLIGCAVDLNAQVSLLVVLSDLAVSLKLNSSYLKQDLLQLSWMIINQALGQLILVSNLMFAVGGLTATIGIFQTKSLPKWLFWVGMPVWLLSFSGTFVAFLGDLSLSVKLLLGFSLGFIVWAVSLAIVLDLRARPDPAESSSQLAEFS
ncbi:MAG: hypothetical protein IT342_03845 [Candidatus Melainabacteria bacterium]|nr:hypothetical protein [Candidatus Melainabacteria bacterium]